MSASFNPWVVARAIDVVDRSGADKELSRLLAHKGRGRPHQHNTRAFLVGCLLSVQWHGTVLLSEVHRILVESLPLDAQRELGVRKTIDGEEWLLTRDAIYRISDAISGYLEFGSGSRPDLDEGERQRRRQAVLALVHSMLLVTLPATKSTARAMDGSGIWSWGKWPRKLSVDQVEAQSVGESTDDGGGSVSAAGSNGPVSHDPDARTGMKTKKDGSVEAYFGYQLHALVRVPDNKQPKRVIPLIESFDLTPANHDVVEPSIGLLDRSAAMGFKVTDLLADRLYNNLVPERWFTKLLERGVTQHVDLRQDQQGFTDYKGMRMAAGWMHCPATPDHLAVINSPGPSASRQEKERFRASIAERWQYAFHRHRRMTAKSGARWICPALDGKVGCPLRTGTVEVALRNGKPVIGNPPAKETAPKCCVNKTVGTKADAQPKVVQKYYWGSEKWRARYNGRTYVEGVFGNIKNPSTENIRRGHFQIVGLGKVTFFVGIALVAYNLRMLRGNTPLVNAGSGNPILEEDGDCHGFQWLTPEEDAMLNEFRMGKDGAGS